MHEHIAFFMNDLYCKSQSAIAINDFLNSRAEGPPPPPPKSATEGLSLNPSKTAQEATSCLSQGPPHQVMSCYNARHSVARDSVVTKALLLPLSHELLVLPIVRTLQEPYN